MALLLIDQDKKRSQAIRSSLEGTPIGLSIESFSSIPDAVNWSKNNPCDLILVSQHYMEVGQNIAAFNSMNKDVPLLILKNTKVDINFNLNKRIYDFLESDFDRKVLLQRIENVLELQNAKLQMRKINDDFPEEQIRRYELAVSGSNDGVWDWNLQTDEVYYSKRWCEILGYLESELDSIPSSWLSRVHPDDVSLLDTAIHSHISNVTDCLAYEYRLRHKNGHYRWVLTRGKLVMDDNDRPWRLVGSQTDISDRKNSEQLIAYNAFHDPLTGLANRALLMERIEQMVIHSRRDETHSYAIMFLDLDKFKEINDNLGHEAGDVILKTVAKRIAVCVREGDTLARFGGDEFVILVAGTCTEKDVLGLAERILKEMAKPIHVLSHELHIGVSIGIVTDTASYEDSESSVRDADLALYHAKSNGRNRYELFKPSMHMNTSKHFALQATLSGAKDRKELVMFYQPILSLATGQVRGFEALMRWKHPENGFIYPLDFIPVAEETGLINEIGAWGIHQSCQQLKAWRSEIPEAQDWFVSVNVSGKQLESEMFSGQVNQALLESGVSGENLVVEITENVLMHDIRQIEPKLQLLKDMGVVLAIDDFGTGYSSLAVLNDFPFDVLKIAREFVLNIHTKPKSERTVRLIHMLAEEMKMKTVVEGIENDQELDTIMKIGCDLAQGFLFSKPKHAEEIAKYLAEKPNSTFFATGKIIKELL